MIDTPVAEILILAAYYADPTDFLIKFPVYFHEKHFAYLMLSVLCLVLDFFDASKYLIFNFSCSNTFVSSSVNCNKRGMSRFSKPTMHRSKSTFSKKYLLIEILSFSDVPVSSPICKVNICLLEIRIYHSDSTVFTTKRSDTY